MNLFDTVFNSVAAQRQFYVTSGFALFGVMALVTWIAFAVSRGVPRPRAVWLPIIVAAASFVLYSELFFWIGAWVFQPGREYVATLGWLSAVLEPFRSHFHIVLALFPALLTAVVVVSVSSFWPRVVLGALTGLGTTLLLEGVFGAMAQRGFLQNPEIRLVGVTTPLVGTIVGLVGASLDSLFISPGGRLLLRRGTIAASLLVALVGLVWLLVHPLDQRVVILAKDWERMAFSSPPRFWRAVDGKITARAKWLKFQLADNGMRLEVGTALSPRWQPTRLEIRRVPLEEPGQRVRRVTPFSVLPGDVVYANDNPNPLLRFTGPARECVVVGASALANGVDVGVSLPPHKRVELTSLDQEGMEWPENQQQKGRPRTITVGLRNGLGDMSVVSEGRGVWSLFCYGGMSGESGPVFGLEDNGPLAQRANLQFEPKRIDQVFRLFFHPPVVISAGRPKEKHGVKLLAKVTRVTFEREALRMGSGLGSSGLQISDLEVEAPEGDLQVGRSRHMLTSSDHISIGGDQLAIRRASGEGIRVDGRSPTIRLNDEVISRTVTGSVPQWLQEQLFSLLVVVFTNVFTFFWTRRRYRRAVGNGTNS